ncbi:MULTISPECIES: RidA family protein [Rhizobium]|jgi:enamine deaminase RidA (YjgF/YER057c/UK114 family)|uniref:Enamine deaminase RidA (YjgF/YER057c/UK114 family) n=1 Tax=Rhizobium soli TaxID=424798 RepID=A0A7X0JML9_9HYPH|nr:MULTISPECIES: RidA family protein [Rhizobium]MBB6510389.1 enamine deaminase RidA (YjgF/YER057c/UK114 family) [Rhizobium soli]MBP2462863.1 enamine deaminase RidA (YjgF/YER057c/UK114 family) [Rhizobium sp. PvP014]MBP2530257.1 enamine deaminase RidA (YjgF/YER057c/UK114 family) [Rhizobium sp. PvP099]RYE67853.1 MAG: RidA family protein [Rhizobiaceae bacterium]
MVTHISSGSPFEARIGYSRAVVDRDMVYVSGTTGYDYALMVMPDDVADQTRNALATIAKALGEAGSSLKDVVRVRYYLVDMADYDAVVEVVGSVFAQIRPAATMIVCGLTTPEMKIEIEVTARIGAGAS